jgi:DNA-binding NarL/FixJ family response regulator
VIVASPSTVAVISKRPAIALVASYVLDPSAWDVRSLERPGDLTGLPEDALVLVDVDASAEGLDVPEVRRRRPDVRVVAIGADVTGPAILDALRLGVRAYVRTPDELLSLEDVLTRVVSGDVVLHLDLQEAAVAELGHLVQRVRDGAGVAARLTQREREILALLADGLTARQVATRLSISPRTVERHASAIYGKLGVRTRVEAVTRAAAMGLVDVR